MKRIFISMIFALIVISCITIVNAIPISSCQIITSSGTYELNTDLVVTEGCFNISADNVVLDLGGHRITGDKGSGESGVFGSFTISNPIITNVVIKNGEIKNFFRGVVVYGSSWEVKNLTIYGDSFMGFNSDGINFRGDSNSVKNVTVYSYDNGVNGWNGADYNNVENSIFYDNIDGILLAGDNNILTNITARDNDNSGIKIVNGINNRIINSNIYNTSQWDVDVQAYYGEEYCDNKFQNVKVSGGYLEYYNYSVNLQNKNLGELILCDSDYSNVKNITILGSETKQNNGVYVVHTNFSNFENINSSSNIYGFKLWNSPDNVFRNNTINYNGYGFYLYDDSHYNQIIGNTANNNSYAGIMIFGNSDRNNNNIVRNNIANFNNKGMVIFSYNNTIIDNIANNNTESGISLGQSGYLVGILPKNNSIIGNRLENNKFGIEFYSPGASDFIAYNYLENNSIKNNNYGISLSGSEYVYNNSLINNTITGCSDDGIQLGLSDNNKIIGNILTNNNLGIRIMGGSNNNLVQGNIVRYNSYGIRLQSNLGNKLIDNNFCANEYTDAECIGCTAEEFTNNRCDSGDVCGGSCIDCSGAPTTQIILPVHESNYTLISGTTAIIQFNQTSYDPDNDLRGIWDFGDGSDSGWIDNCLTTGDCNTTHQYTVPGDKNIRFKVEEMDGNQWAEDITTIFVYREGINVFAIITEPKYNKTVEGRVVYIDASKSRAVNCSFDQTECDSACGFSGCCEEIIDEVRIPLSTIYCYQLPNRGIDYNLIFEWTFDGVIGKIGNWGAGNEGYYDYVEFVQGFRDPGEHDIGLRVGYEAI